MRQSIVWTGLALAGLVWGCGASEPSSASKGVSASELVVETRRLSDEEIRARGYDVVDAAPALPGGPAAEGEAELFEDGLRSGGIFNALAEVVTGLLSDNSSIQTTTLAHAIPAGSTVFDLTGGTRQYAVYEKKMTSLLGFTLLQLTYRISFDTGLQHNGNGAYIANVTFTPLDYEVDGLWDVAVTGTSMQARNVGTDAHPVAQVGFSITTKMSGVGTKAVTDVFEVRGNGTALQATIRSFE
jgi:hypothetical protein